PGPAERPSRGRRSARAGLRVEPHLGAAGRGPERPQPERRLSRADGRALRSLRHRREGAAGGPRARRLGARALKCSIVSRRMLRRVLLTVLLGRGACKPVTKSTREAVDSGTPTASLAGDALYAKLCAVCHAGDATGYKADNAPSLVNRTFL